MPNGTELPISPPAVPVRSDSLRHKGFYNQAAEPGSCHTLEVVMTLLREEIHQQPDVTQALLDQEGSRARKIAAELRAKEPRYVVLAARGSSDNAARYGNYVFGSLLRLPVALATPSLYTLYARPPRLRDALVIGVSQSGQPEG